MGRILGGTANSRFGPNHKPGAAKGAHVHLFDWSALPSRGGWVELDKKLFCWFAGSIWACNPIQSLNDTPIFPTKNQ